MKRNRKTIQRSRKLSAILSFVLFVLLSGCDPSTTDLYVTHSEVPQDDTSFTTIDAALHKVLQLRKKSINHTITIHLKEGAYRLKNKITISQKHGPLKISGEGADKTSIKGSTKYTLNWEKFNTTIWVAQLDKNEYFDQLFIDNKPQTLARYPNYDENNGHWQGHAADAISVNRIKTWQQPTGAIVHAMHSGEWGGFHYRATGVDPAGNLILTGGHQNNRPSPMHKTYRMVENVLEELDSPGEWFLDTAGKLYYWPTEGIDLKNALIEGATQKQLLEFVGTEENPVTDISIEGIRFEHTKRTFMEAYEPLLRSDWTIHRGGALFLEGTEDITINQCEFTAVGGNAIFVSGYNKNLSITENHIHDCGASGICFVGRANSVRSPSFQYSEFVPLAELDTLRGPKSNAYPRACLVEDNLIHNIGRIEKQTAGVEIAMAMRITIRNNSIYNVPRAGINVGDGTWGGHLLEYNDVFNTVLESGDHGAFNSWGRDRFWHPNRDSLNQRVTDNPSMPTWDAIHTTIIRNNRFRCDHGWDIDLDDGSSNYEIYNNLCLNGGIKLREGFNRIVTNNIMINNGFHPHVWFENSGDIFKRNIVYTEHKDIRLDGWGKEVDYNLFVDQKDLLVTQAKGVDLHSIFGPPLFVAAGKGDYRLQQGSPALKIGFKPFTTDTFGVKNEGLRAKAKKPIIPKIYFGEAIKKSLVFEWLGAEIKAIETMAERSASGLDKTEGVLVISIDSSSVLKKSDLKAGDVIIAGEEITFKNVSDFMKYYQNNNWKGKLRLVIFRNQEETTITLLTK